ncbi:MAG: hypothetical protein ACJA08_001725 [Cyclobacteriaceae bacterium]|jgi:hypothetical protein
MVYQDSQAYRAEIVKAVLDDFDLQPVIVNKQDAAYQFGYYEIHVAPENVIRAIKIINEEIRFE